MTKSEVTRVDSVARAEVVARRWVPVKDRVYKARPSESGIVVEGFASTREDLLVKVARLDSRRGDRLVSHQTMALVVGGDL